MQKDDNIRLICRTFRTRCYAKRWFPKDGVRRVGGPCEFDSFLYKNGSLNGFCSVECRLSKI